MSYFLDANCFKHYVDELLLEHPDIYTHVVSLVFGASCFHMDDGGLFVQEWKQTTGGAYNPFVEDLISNWLADGRIKLSPFKHDANIKKSLKKLGIPKIDARIVEFCYGAKVSTVVSEDIDLYEPSQKGCSAAKRSKIICGGSGTVSKNLKKNYGIKVTCCCHFDHL